MTAWRVYIASLVILGASVGVFAQWAAPAVPRFDERQTTVAFSVGAEMGFDPFPPWWAGAGFSEPRLWGGWDYRDETWMHILDVPTLEHPNLRFGFFQHWDILAGLRHERAYVYLARDPTDFLRPDGYLVWQVRVDTSYAWRYIGYWRPGDGWDAVVCECELPGAVQFCEGDADGRVWVVIVFDQPATFMGYSSEYAFCPSTYTYGIGLGYWGGQLGPITRWPVPYQWPPCYILWTDTGHRVW